jgi:uncharacterized protein (TIGR00290 family)
MNKIPAFFNWSGGKDSTLALHYILATAEFEVKYLLTSVNSTYKRISMHGVREELLIKQIQSLQLPLIKLSLPEIPDMVTYEKLMYQQMHQLKSEGIDYAIFGDIFLEDLKQYREKQLEKVGMKAVFPLWKKDSLSLIEEFIDLGYQTVIVCSQENLKEFCGRIIDRQFIKDLPSHIDPCGENGEFHTFVFDGPIFKNKIEFKLGDKVYKNFPSPDDKSKNIGFWYQDLLI